jgi:hypothetical protein
MQVAISVTDNRQKDRSSKCDSRVMQVEFEEKRSRLDDRSIVCFLVARWILINLGQPIVEREKWNGAR